MLDIALAIHPVDTTTAPRVGPTRRWLGIIVLALLVAGLVFAGRGAVSVVGMVMPHRVERP